MGLLIIKIINKPWVLNSPHTKLIGYFPHHLDRLNFTNLRIC